MTVSLWQRPLMYQLSGYSTLLVLTFWSDLNPADQEQPCEKIMVKQEQVKNNPNATKKSSSHFTNKFNILLWRELQFPKCPKWITAWIIV